MTVATATGLSVRREALVSALGRMTPGKDTHLPVLSSVLLETTDSGVRVTSTDLDIWSIAEVPCEASPGLRVLVPHRTLLDAAKRLRGEVLSIEMETGVVSLDGSVNIVTAPPEEFPPAPDEDVGAAWEPSGLVAALHEAAPYTSSDTARPILNGIYLDTRSGRVVATSGHMIIVRRLDSEHDADPVLLPKNIGRALGSTSEVSVRTSGRFCCFDSDEGTVLARLVEGSYPDYRKVTHEPDTVVATCDRAELLRLVELSELVSNREHSLGGQFIARVTEGEIEVASEHVDRGSAELSLPADITGPDMEIALGCGYTRTILSTLKGERVRIAVDAPERIVHFRDPEDEALDVWCMPRRILT